MSEAAPAKTTEFGTFTTTLPSVVAAEDFLKGKPGGLLSVLSSTAGRAGIIFAGLYLAGERKRLLKYSLAGAIAIEAFVLFRIWHQLQKEAENDEQSR